MAASAYALKPRFSKTELACTLLDPGSYQNGCFNVPRKNKVGFNSRCPRVCDVSNPLWTHRIGGPSVPSKVTPNVSSLRSKVPRFPYESFGTKDLEELLCRCGLNDPCECPVDQGKKEKVDECKGKVIRRLYVGTPPRHSIAALEEPRQKPEKFIINPPFYDTRLVELTDFYRGCKWSKWSSTRDTGPKLRDKRPGPAEYTIERKLTPAELCMEAFRSERRRTAHVPRYTDMIIQRQLVEGLPGPASYTPMYPKGTDLQLLGPKAERFQYTDHNTMPGPADHYIRRDFDLPDPKSSKAPSPVMPAFGVGDVRFKPVKAEGPGPADFDTNAKLCKGSDCMMAPFGTSAKRWRENKEEYVDDDLEEDDCKKNENVKECKLPHWFFRSDTTRFKPLKRKYDEPSPADMPLKLRKVSKHPYLQYLAPFNSCVGRFRPSHDFVPMYGTTPTPGPGALNLEKPRCLPAVSRGPLSRAPRFKDKPSETPAPNKYDVRGGVSSLHKTHNVRLQKNIKERSKLVWKPPVRPEPKTLSPEQKELLILEKTVTLLDYIDSEIDVGKPRQPKLTKTKSIPKTVEIPEQQRPKLLRTFMYSRQFPANM